MPEDEDTDTKLALLASLLHPAVFTEGIYLDALSRAGGDVSAAAEDLLMHGAGSVKRKKAAGGLDNWLGRSNKKQKPASPAAPEPRLAAERPSKPKLPPADLSSLLRDDSSKQSEPKAKQSPLPPVILSTPEQIAATVPCTLHTSFLPPPLASSIYLTLLKLSDAWEKRSWYLAGRKVEAPHGNSFYARAGGGYGTPEDSKQQAEYYYAGIKTTSAPDYPDVLRQAADLVEPFINDVLAKRQRYPFEYAGPWRANVCGVNRYDGATSNVGWHSDTMAYLGPYTTIASLSLGTPRAFRLRPPADVTSESKQPIRTYEMKLPHNSLCIMHAGCQERYKHTVPPQKSLDVFRPPFDIEGQPVAPQAATAYSSRINITFRFYRPDFHPAQGISHRGGIREGTPICPCGVPTLLRADQKGKARANMSAHRAVSKSGTSNGVVDDDMVHFWQCQSAAQTGEMKGCGFFRILDAEAEGRGPFVKDRHTNETIDDLLP